MSKESLLNMNVKKKQQNSKKKVTDWNHLLDQTEAEGGSFADNSARQYNESM